jgi:chromosome segregation ATPase
VELTTQLKQATRDNAELRQELDQKKLKVESESSELSEVISPMNEKWFDENRELRNQKIDLQNKLLQKETELQTHVANVEGKSREINTMKRQLANSLHEVEVSNSKLAEKEQQLAALVQQNDSLERKFLGCQSTLNELKVDVSDQYQSTVSQLKRQLETLFGDLDKAKSRIEILENENAELRRRHLSEFASRQAEFANRETELNEMFDESQTKLSNKPGH